MSLSLVRPYFKARMEALGYQEWPDGFNFENIPDSILDQSFHVELRQVNPEGLDSPSHLELRVPVTVRVYLKGYRYPADAIDSAMVRLDDIYKEILKPTNRLSGTGGLRNVLPTAASVDPLNAENDNAVVLVLGFECFVEICAID